VLGGVHAGYNFQSGPIVYGVEGTFAWTNARGSSNLLLESVPVELNPATNIETTMKNVSTVVGRAGFANQAMLYYLLGGIALANEEHLVRQANGIALAPINQDVRSSRSGFVLGFGAEFNVWQNFTAKLEYNYMDFGKKFVAFPAIEGEPVGIRDQLHVVKLGLSYLFH
jgi:outer membrane immunogenic protein